MIFIYTEYIRDLTWVKNSKMFIFWSLMTIFAENYIWGQMGQYKIFARAYQVKLPKSLQYKVDFTSN